MRTYSIKTFGCQMNYADSEKIESAMLSAGLFKATEDALPDVLILNTCSVRQKGEDRVFTYIAQSKKQAKKIGKEIIVGVTGCMVRKTGISRNHLDKETGRDPNTWKIELLSDAGAIFNKDDELLHRSDNIDFVFRIEEVGYLTKILSAITGKHIGTDDKWEEYLRAKQARENPASANVIIQTGCDNFCTYCIVPHTRGRETSRPIEDIVQEVQEAVKNGAKEVTLLGQNVNSYGKETKKSLWNPESLTWNTDKNGAVEGGKTPFRELLEAIGKIEWLQRIRFTSSNPHDMTKDILNAHFEVPNMCNYLHFALQSGSDEVLKKMNRKHSLDDFIAQVKYLRDKDPLFGISTDIIVGFPGETQEDFEATCEAFRKIEFDFAYIARYSPRKGTYAADSIGDTISSEVKTKRWSILTGILAESVKRRGKMMIGKTEKILVNSVNSEGECSGRTNNFKEVFFEDKEKMVQKGDFVNVKITGMKNWVLTGEVVA